MPTDTVGKERELGRGAHALRRISGEGDPSDSLSVRMEIGDAPRAYRRAMASRLTEDVFGAIEPRFPVLLRRATEHQMGWSELVDELDLILAMADIRDPASSVYVYSLQVVEPARLRNVVGEDALPSLAPPNYLIELRNGYISHELLYGLPAPRRNMILMTLLMHSNLVRVSVKPPWSAYRVEPLVRLVAQASAENTRSTNSSSSTFAYGEA
jgi:hypothetical protein